MLIPHNPSRFLHRTGNNPEDIDDVSIIEVPYNEAGDQPVTSMKTGRSERINAQPE